MSEEVENVDIEETIEHETELAERVNKLEEGQDLTALLSDAEIMAVIEAKQAGKKVKVEIEEPKPEPSVVDKAKELVKDLPKDDPNRDAVSQLAKLFDEKLTPLVERLDAVEGHASAGAKKEINVEIAKAQERFSDFDEFRSEMVDLSKAFPELTIPELYIIAKNRKGKLDLADPTTFTEKPASNTVERRNPTNKPSKDRPKGRKGRSAMVTEALGRIDFSDVGG